MISIKNCNVLLPYFVLRWTVTSIFVYLIFKMFILTYTLNLYIKHNRTLTTYTRICLEEKRLTFYLFNNISSIIITLIFDIHDGPFDNLQTLNFQIGWYNNLAFDIANCHSVSYHTSIESVNETQIPKRVAFFSLNTQLCNY